ncbi:MAG: acetoacetate metabolism regulatory protein AtoC [Bryobacteraceae bacterium]|nr:MAG: acetoacetate metabolism regulatory protein AtoC [Bryobacteraceae bacterium]
MPEANRPGVLVVDDELNQRSALASMLEAWGYRTETAADGREALEKLREFDAAAIVTDLMMPGMDGAELLRRLRELGNAPPAIVLTAFGNIETAIRMVHDLGAFWFLEKPLQTGALRLLLERAVAQRRLAEYSERLERQLSSQGVLGDLVGASPPMREIFSLIRQVAPTSATVLITGESGTGKELAARALHQLSPRRDGPFVAINCAAMPETLIESELFGHEKGAFTGALERRRGCFELAHGGTLLLDEIGEMPLATQAKLLRVLEERRVRRLGGAREIDVDVRVIAASNRRLDDEVRAGRFREDLYFRLHVFEIRMPPLRERLADLPLLCEAMIAELNQRHQCRVTGVSPDALEWLRQQSWPGNVRQLRNALERAVILAGSGPLGRQHFDSSAFSPSKLDAAAAAGNEIRLPIGTTVDEAERALIEATLRYTNNNRTRAAAILGISQKTLFNKLREYGAEQAGE